MPPDPDATMIEEEVLAAERGAAFRAAFDTLPSGCRALLSLLASDPLPGYTEISAALGVAVGSVGPMRARCLERLRRSPQVASLADDALGSVGVRQTRSEGA
jgi:DNA-directed RNA polymerase specialized sigma24 family protein